MGVLEPLQEVNVTEPKDIVTAPDTRAFFHDRVRQVLTHHDLRLDDHTEFYLVNLLADAARPEQLYEVDAEGRRDEVPLAFLLARALAQPPRQRLATFRRLGDRSLVVSGFFSDSLAGRLVDVDYYIAMGGRAYEHAAELTGTTGVPRPFAGVFSELARRFTDLVDCLMELSEEARTTKSTDVVRTYERWRHTGSTRLARRLTRQGIVLTPGKQGGWVH